MAFFVHSIFQLDKTILTFIIFIKEGTKTVKCRPLFCILWTFTSFLLVILPEEYRTQHCLRSFAPAASKSMTLFAHARTMFPHSSFLSRVRAITLSLVSMVFYKFIFYKFINFQPELNWGLCSLNPCAIASSSPNKQSVLNSICRTDERRLYLCWQVSLGILDVYNFFDSLYAL